MSCGRTCPGLDLRIVDESGKELGTGRHDELVLAARTSWAATGIIRKKPSKRSGMVSFAPEISATEIQMGTIYTLDRLKDMIVAGGENVYSGEVEAVIYQHPAVRKAAVFGIPDPRWGELVAACVVRKQGKTLSEDE
jgi:acyl-CoA synthetase (AMP-forming)/AMP-acid ligase II